jgi:hypothetical protein
MFKSIRIAGVVAALAVSAPALAATHALEADYGVRGILHYCKYANGKIYTVDASEPCPASVQDRPAGNGKGIGNLKGESHDGNAKFCLYNVNGVERHVRMDATANCPLNYEF